jgi:hypothetical protein
MINEIFYILDKFLYYFNYIVFFILIKKYFLINFKKNIEIEYKEFIEEENYLKNEIEKLNIRIYANEEELKIQNKIFDDYEKDINKWKSYKEKLKIENELNIKKAEKIFALQKELIIKNKIENEKIDILKNTIFKKIEENEKTDIDKIFLKFILNESYNNKKENPEKIIVKRRLI